MTDVLHLGSQCKFSRHKQMISKTKAYSTTTLFFTHLQPEAWVNPIYNLGEAIVFKGFNKGC